MRYGKAFAALATASLIAGGALVSSATSADAQWRRGGWHGGGWHGGHAWRGHRGHWRGGWGAPVAAGLIGGLALGAIASSAVAAPYYYDSPYVYSGRGAIEPYTWRYARPVVYDSYSAPVRCWWQRQRVQLDPWTYQVRRVRVCN